MPSLDFGDYANRSLTMAVRPARCLVLAFALGLPSVYHAAAYAGTPAASPVFVDTAGKCPLVGAVASPVFCRHTIYGNVATANFHLPFRPWGIAYAYNCGPRARDFGAVVGIINLDSFFSETEINRHGRRGRGYYMETGRANATWRTIIPPYRAAENIELHTACAFHVRAVYGRANVVGRYVPRVPPF